VCCTRPSFGLILILSVANGPKLNRPFVPLAVGAYIMAWGTMGGPFEGASMNPARSFRPDVAIGDLSTWWIYLTGPLIGAVIAMIYLNVSCFSCVSSRSCDL
jgi:glycerol uptake facilitator-like aquaporin